MGLFDLITVGHFSIDFIISPKIAVPRPTLGGSPTYTSLTARRLGARVSVISKIGEDFPLEYMKRLEENGIDLSAVKRINGALTTRFVLTYSNNDRWLRLGSRAPTIEAEDIPDSLKSKAVHVAPIANEISQGAFKKLHSLGDILSMDPQGFLRVFDAEGNTRLEKMRDHRVLEGINIYKSSRDEIEAATGTSNLISAIRRIHKYGAEIVIVTQGIEGSMLSYRERVYSIPACKPKKVEDPTGAGDAFIGAFLAEYIKGRDPLWCASVGSAAASFIVEGLGPSRFGSKEEIYERADKTYREVTELHPEASKG